MIGIGRTLLPALAGAVAVAAMVVGVASGQEKRPVTLTVGLTRDFDSLNPLVGVVVPDYDVWNMQYATLTDKSDKDFSTIPGLAQSWKGSSDGRTWSYKLRPNLKWSDGQPLTSEDVAYTINRAKEEEWLNYTSVVPNLTASAPDPQTVVIKSSVPDPKLPTVDAYILPKHIWGKLSASEITKYRGTDGVGSGPFTVERFARGQLVRMKANPNWHGGKPAVDRIVFRQFNNPGAMVAALRRGEVDAVHDVPNSSFRSLQEGGGGEGEIVAVEGHQGGFDELAMNAGDGLEDPHPALLDRRVRVAISHAIDKKTIVERVWNGLATPADTMSVSPNEAWSPQIPPAKRFSFDLDKAKQILDQAGYRDTDGDGIREMPDGGRALRLRYAVRSESQVAAPTAEFITGWLRQIGIATTQRVYDDTQLTEVIGKGEYDLFHWGWTPFVDPDPMLSYFTCDNVSQDPEDPTNYYNDASLCDREYDRLYEQQKVELDKAKRMDIVHRMLTRFHDQAAYVVLYHYGDLQAYRTDRFTGWTKQPAKTGPVIFTQSSHTYANLKPVAAGAGGGGDDGGGGGGALIAVIVVAALALGGGAFLVARRRTADERE